jgi:outer membrane protein assembly factor BamD (BamD/ComL family)
MDLYAGEAKLQLQTDIEHEAEQYFVYSLAAAGGADAFAREFPAGETERPYERRVLRAMGQHLRRYGELTKAVAVDQLYLDRWPGDPAALEVAGRLADTEHKAERPDQERATRLEWAERFAPGGAWASAQASDSLKGAGEAFAREAWREEAFAHHRDARTTGSRAEWQAALQYYETLLARWPGDSAARTYELHAGEACAELGEYAKSLKHYRAAAAATAAGSEGAAADSVASRAAWQVVAVTDRWYESTRAPAGAGGAGAAKAPGADSLAHAFVREADAFLASHPKHPQAADLVWRECQLALAHGWNDDAQAALARFARGFPTDKRAPLAAGERAEAYFRGGDFAAASDAFEEALAIAKRAGADTLARRAERALPICAYRRAEAAVAADSTQHARHAELFAEVAHRWPDYEHAPLAQYRAGLAWLDAGQTEKGVQAFQELTTRWPANVLAREASLKSAQAWEAAGDRERASAAYIEFAKAHAKDDNADEAWLKAADLADSAGQGEHADNLRKEYLKRWPNDRESALEILEKLAHQELATVSAEKPLASLLATPKAVGNKPVPPPSYLQQYLKLAAQKPALASKALLAEVRFQSAEEAWRKYDALKLTQPLPKSIAAKQKLLDSVLVRYRRTVDMGEPEWAHAAGYRIGQALVGFGSALEASERPADLKGDDLKAYENVLIEQSMTFHERGETVWSDLLQRSQGGVADAWVTKTRQSLWTRLGDRFLFQPDAEFPVVEGKAPPHARSSRSARDTASAPAGVASGDDR